METGSGGPDPVPGRLVNPETGSGEPIPGLGRLQNPETGLGGQIWGKEGWRTQKPNLRGRIWGLEAQKMWKTDPGAGFRARKAGKPRKQIWGLDLRPGRTDNQEPGPRRLDPSLECQKTWKKRSGGPDPGSRRLKNQKPDPKGWIWGHKIQGARFRAWKAENSETRIEGAESGAWLAGKPRNWNQGA